VTDKDIYRCSDGHLYSADFFKVLLLSLHLGIATHYQRCPVDRRWRVATRVKPAALTPEQLAEARQQAF
jgi:hypothetical protein